MYPSILKARYKQLIVTSQNRTAFLILRFRTKTKTKTKMESAFALSPTFRILKTPKPNPSHPLRRLQSTNLSTTCSIANNNNNNASISLSCFGWCKPVGPSPGTRADSSSTNGRAHNRETAVEEEVEVVLQSNKLLHTIQLGVLIIFWYSLTTLFNIYNKQVLETYPFPWTISTLHFGIGTLIVLLMWTSNLHKRPKITTSQLVAILPLAIAHTLGNLFTNMSLGKVSVSFTHTIKAMEPFYSVILSALFLGEIKEPLEILIYSIPTFWVVSSLVPVVGGVALASFTEASFDWIGFWSAMASNLTNQSRNVFSKKFMIKKNEEYLDNITLFSIITIMSFVLMAPATLLMEGVKFTPAYLQSAGLNFTDICVRSLVAGLFYHSYQQVAYVILERVSPVTHSVSNCVKRIVIIVTSVLFFRTPVSRLNCIGTGLAIAGVFLYSRLKQIKPKPKKD